MAVEILAAIDAPHFYAGIILRDDIVVDTAPILDYMRKQRWSRDRVRDYCAKKGWKVSVARRVEV